MSVVVPKKGLNFRLLCPDCQNAVPNLVEDYASGDVICRDCGSVLMARVIDTHSEWRTFASEPTGAGDDPSRVGGRRLCRPLINMQVPLIHCFSK